MAMQSKGFKVAGVRKESQGMNALKGPQEARGTVS